jgi:xanthine/uracil permease
LVKCECTAFQDRNSSARRNRAAGRWCCVYLILFGVLGKISGALLAIPNPVLGGITTFLFASVAVSRLRVLSYVRPLRARRRVHSV